MKGIDFAGAQCAKRIVINELGLGHTPSPVQIPGSLFAMG
jgi:hypothetical protein